MNAKTTTLPALLRPSFDHAERPVLVGPWRLSYGELSDTASRLASVLDAAGLGPGDRVAYQMEKSPLVLALHLAALQMGAVQLPLNPAYTDDEVTPLLHDAEPTVVVRDPERAVLAGSWTTLSADASGAGTLAEELAANELFTRYPHVEPDDPAALLYTSGTTGRPKGAVLSHANLAHNARSLVAVWGFTSDDVLLHMLPMFHTHGLFVATHCALVSGSAMYFLPRFDLDSAVAALPEVSVVMGVPTHYSRLLEDDRFNRSGTAHVRVFISGSAPMPRAVHARFTATTGQVVLERYGMTETSMLTSNPLEGPRRPGSVGQVLPGVELRITDDADAVVTADSVGNVQVRGPNVFGGYWRRPDLQETEFTADGWFRTGDLGRLDAEGWLEVVGRAKDLVITGGLNVHPSEVEAVLDAVDGVVESAVVGLPDPDLGEAVTAVVVLAPGAQLTDAGIRTAARRRLAGFKVPKRVVVAGSLPRNAMGKVEKARLRAQLMRPS